MLYKKQKETFKFANEIRGVKMPKAVIIDYGVGNIFSIKCSLEKASFNAVLCSDKQELKNADAVVLPGVGNFRVGAENLREVKSELLELILGGVPVLGICLGMQLLFERSDESSGAGLNILDGVVVRLPKIVRIPHMGWNTLNIIKHVDILDGIGERDYFYFAHSYHAIPASRNMIAAETEYGIRFASVIAHKNIFGVQFHPEKSDGPGEQVIKNFMGIVKR
jgi:glutamine amidotransferase